MQLHEIVSINPKRMGGIPVFTNTRIPIEYLFESLGFGQTIAEFLDDYDVKPEQAIALIELKFKYPEIYEVLIRPQHPGKIQSLSK